MSRKGYNERRASLNLSEAEALRKDGYKVITSQNFPNNSYYAIEKGAKPKPHEKLVAEIFAENGFPNILAKEGTVIINGSTMPSFDGVVSGYTYEIRQTGVNVKKRLGNKIADAIQHSNKQSKSDSNNNIQADFAVSVTTNPRVRESHVLDGIKYHRNRVEKSKPKALLQVDGIKKKIYVYKIK